MIIDLGNIVNLIKQCKKQGLFLNIDEQEAKRLVELHRKDNHHHIAFRTEYVYEAKVYSVLVEFHYRFFPNNVHQIYFDQKAIVKEALESIERIKINNYEFPVLNIVYDLIFVGAHAIRHYLWDMRRAFFTDKNYYINLSNFLDVLYILKKCSTKNISFNSIKQIICKCNILDEMLLLFYIEKTYFNIEFVDDIFLKKEAEAISQDSRWISLFSKYAITQSFSEEFLLPIREAVKKTIRINSSENFHVLCSCDFCDIKIPNNLEFDDSIKLQVKYDTKILTVRFVNFIGKCERIWFRYLEKPNTETLSKEIIKYDIEKNIFGTRCYGNIIETVVKFEELSKYLLNNNLTIGFYVRFNNAPNRSSIVDAPESFVEQFFDLCLEER